MKKNKKMMTKKKNKLMTNNSSFCEIFKTQIELTHGIQLEDANVKELKNEIKKLQQSLKKHFS